MNIFDFNLFGNKPKYPESNVVPFPYVAPLPVQEHVPEACYTIGPTNDNRVAMRVGMTTLTMDKVACENFIEQLQVVVNQLEDEE